MANKNLSVWTSIPFWRRSAAWVTGFASMLLIWLTFDTLGQITMGTDADLKAGTIKRVPAPTVINYKIGYEMSKTRGHEVPTIGEKEPFFGKEHSVEEAAALLHLGKLTSQAKNCMNCHTLLGNGAYYAPDLTKAWIDPSWSKTGPMIPIISTTLPSKLVEKEDKNEAENTFLKEMQSHIDAGKSYTKEEAMAIFLQYPSSYPTHARMMPELGITADEAKGLVAFLKHMSSIDTNGFPRNFGVEEGTSNAH